MSQRANQAEAFPGFCSMKRQGIFVLHLDGILLVHRRATASIKFAGTHLYTWVESGTVRVSVLPKNTTQCPWPGHKPGLLNPE